MIVVSGVVVHRRKGLVALVLLVGPLTSLLWRAWLGAHDVASSNSDLGQSQLTSPGFLFDRIHRLTYALRYMLEAPWHGDYRTAAIICIAVAVVIAVVRRITAITIAATAWLTLSFLALAATYWTATIDLHFYVATSASRVGGTIIVSAATITPLLLGLALPGDREAVTLVRRVRSEESARPKTEAVGDAPASKAQPVAEQGRHAQEGLPALVAACRPEDDEPGGGGHADQHRHRIGGDPDPPRCGSRRRDEARRPW